jgi:replicative DNA helicase
MLGKKSLELSKALLATLAYIDSSFYRVADRLHPDMWKNDRKLHQLASAIWHVKEKGGTVSIPTLLANCPDWKAADLRKLQQYVDPKNIELLADEFYGEYRSEKEISIANMAIERLLEGKHYSEVLSECEQKRAEAVHISPTDKNSVITNAIKNAEAAHENDKAIIGIPTGDEGLDKITGGWRNGRYYLIAARPSMGKTTDTLAKAVFAAKEGYPVLFYSLEDDDENIYSKAACYLAGLDYERVGNGMLRPEEFDRFYAAMEEVSNIPFYVEGGSGRIDDILNLARVEKQKKGIKMVVIDYIQLCSTGKRQSRYEEITEISRKIKIAAGKRDLHIPILVLSQLSREVEKRGGAKIPILADLRESGGLEQDADFVSFLWRPERYGMLMDEEGESLEGVGDYIVAKNKNGRIATLRRYFEYPYTHYSDQRFNERAADDMPKLENVQINGNHRGAEDDDLPF